MSAPVDPAQFSTLKDLLLEKTYKKYRVYWVDYIESAGLSPTNPPTEENLMAFLRKRRSEGLCGNSLTTLVSGLNTFHLNIYGTELKDVSKSNICLIFRN